MEFDLHIHSKYSYDSISQPKKILEIAQKKGLAGIAITDHGTVRGGIEAMTISNKLNLGLFVISGIEVATEYGDILGLFLSEEIKSRNTLDVIDEIKAKGGIAVLPHPYKRASKIQQEILSKIDAIEVFNARGERHTFDSISRNEMARNLARHESLPCTAGSDAHFYFEIGRGRCIIDNVSSIEDIKQAILRGRVTVPPGTNSSPYVEPLSQVIKAFKVREPMIFYNIARQMSIISVFEAVNMLKSIARK